MKYFRKPSREVSFDPTIETDRGPPISIAGADFRILNIADDYCAILQRRREELINTEWRNLIHPDDAADQTDMQAILLATGKPYEATSRARRGDGQWITGHCRASLIQDSEGRPPLIQCNAWFEPIVSSRPLTPTQPIGAIAVTEYIQSMSTELAKLAGEERMTLLQHLLSMVSLQAAEELQRQLLPTNIETFPTALN